MIKKNGSKIDQGIYREKRKNFISRVQNFIILILPRDSFREKNFLQASNE